MADNQPTPSESSSHSRGGRRRGRGGAASSGRDSQRNGDGTGRTPKPRTRGSGRGAAESGRDRQNHNADQTHNNDTQSTSKATIKAKKPVVAATDDADDGEICFICASPVEHTSVSPCNHRTCHICALRLRALYKNKACAHCRVWSLQKQGSWANMQRALEPAVHILIHITDRIKFRDLYR
jgi:hypothetical protein